MASPQDDREHGLEALGETDALSDAELFDNTLKGDRRGWKRERYQQYGIVLEHIRRILSAGNSEEQLFEWSVRETDTTHRVIVCACTDFRVGYTHTTLRSRGDYRDMPEYTCSGVSLSTIGKAVGHIAADIGVRRDPTANTRFIMQPPPRGVSMARTDSMSFWYHHDSRDQTAPHLPEPKPVLTIGDIQAQLGVLIEAAFVLEQCNPLTVDDVRSFAISPPTATA